MMNPRSKIVAMVDAKPSRPGAYNPLLRVSGRGD